jgi:hypothetical protein
VLFFIARAYRNNLTDRRSRCHTPCNKPCSLSFRAPISACGSPSAALLLATSDRLIYSTDAAGADGSVSSSIVNETNHGDEQIVTLDIDPDESISPSARHPPIYLLLNLNLYY